MYSYLHRFHAGNFADCHKHFALVYLISKLKSKNTAFCVMDAFAGEGKYSLESAESLKNSEFKQGILKFFQTHQDKADGLSKEYLDLVQSFNPGMQKNTSIKRYPGSPAIIAKLLRPQDRAILIENHANCYPILKRNFHGNSQLSIHKRDAYEALSALVPFSEKRGIIFLDPSYEVKQEYKKIVDSVLSIYKKFPQAIFLIWYPMLRKKEYVLLKKKLLGNPDLKTFNHEVMAEHHPNADYGLQGSGLIIINPPWKMHEEFQFTI